MKKINIRNSVIMVAALLLATVVLQNCTGGEKKPDTTLVTPVGDTTRVIDTTIIEPGVAPLADNVMARRPDKEEKQKKEKISCGFNFKKFNNRKRPIEEAPGGKKGKPCKNCEPPPPPPPPTDPNQATNIIYLNFFGKTVANTMWNVSGAFTVQDAGLSQIEIDEVLSKVRTHYANYNVYVTLDKAIYDAAPYGHKTEVVITEDWSWYGQAGGVAYINSFFWSDGSPAFVFSTLLNYNSGYIAEAASHEAAHTLGLRHQCDCADGVKTNEYSYGKVMGYSYGLLGAWVTGPNPFCATQIDQAILQSSLGLK